MLHEPSKYISEHPKSFQELLTKLLHSENREPKMIQGLIL